MIGVGAGPGQIRAVQTWFDANGKAANTSNRQALTLVGRKARTQAVREIAPLVGVQQKSIRRRLKVFASQRINLGAGDFVRLWLGLRAGIHPKNDRRVVKGFRGVFKATMPSGHAGLFVRRPNKLRTTPNSTHANPSRAGRPNPARSALPIDEVKISLDHGRMAPILIRQARVAFEAFFEREFRRLLELKARRAAGR